MCICPDQRQITAAGGNALMTVTNSVIIDTSASLSSAAQLPHTASSETTLLALAIAKKSQRTPVTRV